MWHTRTTMQRILCAVALVIQVCCSADPGYLLDLDLEEPTDECLNKQDEAVQTWCPLNDVSNDPNYKCWVTCHRFWGESAYVAQGSICEHSAKAVAVKCIAGQWKTGAVSDFERPRVRRWWWGRRRSPQAPPPNKPPNIRCPDDITRAASSGQTTASVSWPQPTASDDGGTPTLSQIQGPMSGSSFREGPTLIKYRATDNQGATAECTFTVTVIAASTQDEEKTNLLVVIYAVVASISGSSILSCVVYKFYTHNNNSVGPS